MRQGRVRSFLAIFIVFGIFAISVPAQAAQYPAQVTPASAVSVITEGELRHQIELGGERTIILGGDITVTGSNFVIPSGANITLQSSLLVGNPSIIMTGSAVGRAITVSGSNTRLTINGVNIREGNSSVSNAWARGGIDVLNGATVILNEGEISGFRTAGAMPGQSDGLAGTNFMGTGVNVGNDSRFEMHGGAIRDNRSGRNIGGGGGGVFLGVTGLAEAERVPASFMMTGGEISNNDGGMGGAVQASEFARFEMSGGIIHNNTSVFGGGVVTVGPRAYFKMSGGGIYENTAGQGGGVLGLDSYIEMTGGEIHNNTSNAQGGGVALVNSGIIIRGGRIRNNISNGQGGGIASWGSTLGDIARHDIAVEMYGGYIHDNIAGGGGIYLNYTDEGYFRMYGGEIFNNTADYGGGIYIASAESVFRMYGGEFRANRANYHGGGIFAKDIASIITADYLYFRGNSAGGGAFLPPTNAASDFPNIGFASSSIRMDDTYLHPINNFDINHPAIDEEALTLHQVYYFANDGGGGGLSIASFAVDTGNPGNYTVLTPIVIRYGYDFIGWSRRMDGSSAGMYQPGDVITVAEDVNFYAQWAPIQLQFNISVTVPGGGGTAGASAATAVFGTSVTVTATPNTGYRFVRWVGANAAQLDDVYNPVQTFNMPADDVTLEAEFEAIQFNISVTVPGGGGTAGASAATAVFGTSVTVTATPNIGYRFVRWTGANAAQLDDVYNPVQTFNMPANDVTLEAEFEAVPIDITVTATPGGEAAAYVGGAEVTAAYYGIQVELIATPTVAGYSFVRWSGADVGLLYDAYEPETSFNMPRAIVTFEAEFTLNHVVRYLPNGGTGDHVSQVPNTGASDNYTVQSIAVTGITRPYFSFEGWNTEADGSGYAHAAGAVLTVNTDLYLYAQWLPLPSFPPLPAPPTPSQPYELHLAYMIGDEHGAFRPGANITRAEVATILARTQLLDFAQDVQILPSGMGSFDVFADVDPGDWHYFYIAWAYDAGLIRGFGGYFRPNDLISREEVAAMMARMGAIFPAEVLSGFYDAGAVSDWARDYVYTAHRTGLMIGDEGLFRPNAHITRVEVATATNRTLGRIDSIEALEAATVENIAYARQFPDVSDYAWYFPSVLGAANDRHLRRSVYDYIYWIKILRG